MKKFVFLTAFLCARLAAAEIFPATYEVPTPAPSPYSFYPMQGIDLQIQNGQVTLCYDLPLELTGAPNQITVSGPLDGDHRQIAQLTGPKADAVCDFAFSRCELKYHDLVIDPQQVVSRLQQRQLPAGEIEARLEVTRHFSGDPIGVIHFTQPGDESPAP